MKVYKYGSKATTVMGEIKGIIVGTWMKKDNVQYQLSYFYNGKKYSEWLEECELKFDKSQEQITIGYK